MTSTHSSRRRQDLLGSFPAIPAIRGAMACFMRSARVQKVSALDVRTFTRPHSRGFLQFLARTALRTWVRTLPNVRTHVRTWLKCPQSPDTIDG